MPAEVKDKDGVPIHVGDTVSNRARGGKQVGKVSAIVTTEEEAAEREVGHPPKVLFGDQHGHHVAHYPPTVIHGDNPFK
ncbi:hypothetical protein BDQ12DRAFT_636980 [Crucibulum laeve]|uniref:Hypervirulence associated protein TUDOR domain-containing protein n=1 Tax=Crucibulum laeve TaxID=68775 RepID=A0A5C3LMJ0_9AGAR|nr:hypothetical protein BDQ12DRAFT_636980 [Crucibulum laeve]